MTIYSQCGIERRDDHTEPLNEGPGGLHQPGLHGGLGHQHHRLRQLRHQPEEEQREVIVQGLGLLQAPAGDDWWLVRPIMKLRNTPDKTYSWFQKERFLLQYTLLVTMKGKEHPYLIPINWQYICNGTYVQKIFIMELCPPGKWTTPSRELLFVWLSS